MLSRLVLSSVVVLLFAPPASGIAGGPACPDDAKKEVAVLPTARVDDTPCACQTIVSCLNLDKKPTRITVQFFGPGAAPIQVGTNATSPLGPGATARLVTNSDPLQILQTSHSAGISGADVTLKGRVCASSAKIACDAFLSCDCPQGAVFTPLKVILKKQKGD